MILESTDLSTLDLQGTFQVLLCSYVFVYCCGVVISSVFPLSYKSSVFVQYHAPLFREKGIQVDPSFVDCFYHSYKLQPDRSLQSYGVQESDMIVFHDRRVLRRQLDAGGGRATRTHSGVGEEGGGGRGDNCSALVTVATVLCFFLQSTSP